LVALRSEDSDGFFSRKLPDVSVILIHGQNDGLISERLRLAIECSGVNKDDPFNLLRLDGAEIAAEPTRLTDETDTVSLFGGARVIIIDAGLPDITPAIELALRAPERNFKILIRAGALKKDAPLRKFCERDRFAIAVECAPDDEHSLNTVLESALEGAKLEMVDEAKAIFLKSLGSDRMNANAEINKLITFGYGSKTIKLEDVELLLSDSSLIAVERTVHFAFSGGIAKIDDSWNRLITSGADCSMVLGTALREANSLHLLFATVDRGGSFDYAEKRYMNSGFNRKPISHHDLKKWSLHKSTRAIEILTEAVRRSRREASLVPEIALRALWSVGFLVEN
jgi:DNA polymerase-3 subunit delta